MGYNIGVRACCHGPRRYSPNAIHNVSDEWRGRLENLPVLDLGPLRVDEYVVGTHVPVQDTSLGIDGAMS